MFGYEPEKLSRTLELIAYLQTFQITLIQIGKQSYLFWFLLVLFEFSFLLIRSHQKYFFPAVGKNNSRGKKKGPICHFTVIGSFPVSVTFTTNEI